MKVKPLFLGNSKASGSRYLFIHATLMKNIVYSYREGWHIISRLRRSPWQYQTFVSLSTSYTSTSKYQALFFIWILEKSEQTLILNNFCPSSLDSTAARIPFFTVSFETQVWYITWNKSIWNILIVRSAKNSGDYFHKLSFRIDKFTLHLLFPYF